MSFSDRLRDDGEGTRVEGKYVSWGAGISMAQWTRWLLGLVVPYALVSMNVVALHRARLVLGWVTVHGYTILVFNQSHPGLLSLASGHPSVGRQNEYWWWSRSPLGKKRRVLRNNGPVPGLLAYWHSWLKVLVAMGPAIQLTCVVC